MTIEKLKRRDSLSDFTEDNLALEFVTRYPEYRWIEGWYRWYRWDGKRWQHDAKLSVYTETRLLLRLFANHADPKVGPTMRKAATVAAVVKLAKYDKRSAASVDQWNMDIWKLNTQSGIVDLKTGEILPHDPKAYMTSITTAAPEGDCPLWLKFLDRVTASNTELVEYLQRVVGYGLTGSVREHALFFLYGTGRNGKGTFLNTVSAILDEYADNAAIEVLLEASGDRHPTELASLQGKRFVVAQEPDEGRKWAESRVKTLTGGDPISARYMRQDFFSFEPQFKLLIAGNHKPAFKNIDEALRSRLQLIPFTVTIPKSERDPDLADKLKAERNGVLKWMVDGAVKYQEIGLAPPAVVTDATNEYFSAEDTFQQWVDDSCEKHPDYWENTTALFNSWKDYAAAGMITVGDAKKFKQRMENAGFPYKRNRTEGRVYSGIRLNPKTEDDWQDGY